jgi:hypothetical protein
LTEQEADEVLNEFEESLRNLGKKTSSKDTNAPPSLSKTAQRELHCQIWNRVLSTKRLLYPDPAKPFEIPTPQYSVDEELVDRTMNADLSSLSVKEPRSEDEQGPREFWRFTRKMNNTNIQPLDY